jgi:hypothetical protein
MRPGARLVIETPDLPETARRFAAADFEGRALLANWIFGLESPGMAHRFGFESSLLAQVLARCGFSRVREERALSHPGFPGLRLIAVRTDDRAHDVHGAFVRLLFDRDIAGGDQAVTVEIVHELAPDVHRVLGRRPDLAGGVNSLLVRLAVADPRLARAALDAADDRLAPGLRRTWTALLDAPAVAALPATLTAELRDRPAPPGLMGLAFRSVRKRARAWLAARLPAARADRRLHTLPPLAPAVTGVRRRVSIPPPPRHPGTALPEATVPETAVPFLPTGLARAARAELARGLRRFAAGEVEVAAVCFRRAAALAADSPLPFWNLARIEIARKRHTLALARIDDAIAAAERHRSPVLPLLREERAAITAGRRVRPLPVSPFAAGLGEGPE